MTTATRLPRVREGQEIEDAPAFGGALDDAVKTPEVLDEATAKILTAEDILNADDVEYKKVLVPEWGGAIRLKIMSAADAIRFNRMPNRDEAIVQILAFCACDEDGKLLFTSAKQVEKLREKNIKVFSRLQDACLELNGFKKPGMFAQFAKNE
jgi:hypothetical protein